VLWKPSPHAIGVAARLLPILTEHLGPIVATVSTSDEESFGEIARSVDALSFTGGSGGSSILWKAAATKPIPMQLELGSCNSTIIGRDYPLEAAAPVLRTSVLSYAGQKCSNTRRIIAPKAVAPDLYESLTSMLESERVGDPQDEGTTIPPLVAPSNAERYERTLEAWRAVTTARARIPKPQDGSACFVEPEIALAGGDADVLGREIFGPAAVIIPYGTFEEALRLANDTPFALFAGLLSVDSREIAEFQASARAGILKINQPTPGLMPDLPSQGWDASGVGPSELGPDPFRPFLRLQTVYPFEHPSSR
jgi:acyl-CoA reductase-like NAD-dependent aldehyde dehydrogenase